MNIYLFEIETLKKNAVEIAAATQREAEERLLNGEGKVVVEQLRPAKIIECHQVKSHEW